MSITIFKYLQFLICQTIQVYQPKPNETIVIINYKIIFHKYKQSSTIDQLGVGIGKL